MNKKINEFFRKYKGIILPALTVVAGIVAWVSNWDAWFDGFFGAYIVDHSYAYAMFITIIDFLSFISLLSATLLMIADVFVIIFEARRIRAAKTKGEELPIPRSVLIIQYVGSTMVIFSFVVFFCVNAPMYILSGNEEKIRYTFSFANMALHPIISAFTMLDWCINADGRRIKKSEMLYPLAFVVAYIVLIYFGVACGVTFDPVNTYPYIFMDIAKNGLFSIGGGSFGTAYIYIFGGIVTVALSYAMRWMSVKIRTDKEKNAASLDKVSETDCV